MGWEPREFTSYVYEGDRLVGSVTRRESEWSPRDRAEVIALARLEAEMGPHGIPMSEAMDPANQFAFQVNKRPSMDWAAKALGDAQDAFYNGEGKDKPRHGHQWRVSKKPTQ